MNLIAIALLTHRLNGVFELQSDICYLCFFFLYKISQRMICDVKKYSISFYLILMRLRVTIRQIPLLYEYHVTAIK